MADSNIKVLLKKPQGFLKDAFIYKTPNGQARLILVERESGLLQMGMTIPRKVIRFLNKIYNEQK